MVGCVPAEWRVGEVPWLSQQLSRQSFGRMSHLSLLPVPQRALLPGASECGEGQVPLLQRVAHFGGQ